MKVVALHLREFAIGAEGDQDRDRFARSAFNRFYYSAYLRARDLVRAVEGTEKQPRHKHMGEYLVGGIRRKMLELAKRQAKGRGMLSKPEYASLERRIHEHTKRLARVLAEGYKVRQIADYKPEIKACVVDRDIRLDGVTGRTAELWAINASVHVLALERAWQDLGQ